MENSYTPQILEVKQESDRNYYQNEVKLENFIENGSTQNVKFSSKIVIIIDKEKFEICKRLILENVSDYEIASILHIPEKTVRIFKQKMIKFEDQMRERKRKLKELKMLKKKNKIKSERRNPKTKKDVTERLNHARDLIAKNFSTNQISKILKISERSVTRIKKRLREERRQLKAEGKIPRDADSSDEESFRFLKAKEKLQKAKELFQQRLKIAEISKILRISERSVRRWKDRLNRLATDPSHAAECIEPRTRTAAKKKYVDQSGDDSFEVKQEDKDNENDSSEDKSASKRRRFDIDQKTLDYARQLIANDMKIKEMEKLLNLPFHTVRRLRTKILNNVPDSEIITTPQYLSYPTQSNDKLDGTSVTPTKTENSNQRNMDPLDVDISIPTFFEPQQQYGYERKTKTILSDREMILVKLLRDDNVRTMDIARIMNISERSVTRLLTRSKSFGEMNITQELIDEAERLKAKKDAPVDMNEIEVPKPYNQVHKTPDIHKMLLAKNLLAMNVKVKDVAKMLEVAERTITRWKAKFVKDDGPLNAEHDDNGELNPIKLVNTVISSDSSDSSSDSSDDDEDGGDSSSDSSDDDEDVDDNDNEDEEDSSDESDSDSDDKLDGKQEPAKE